jgi:TolB-like protein/Tfp pilus assembly protein PilF
LADEAPQAAARDHTRTGAALRPASVVTDVSNAPAPRWSLRSLAGAMTVLLILGGGLMWLRHEEAPPTPSSAVTSPTSKPEQADEASWRSPLLARTKVNEAALAERGLYAVAVLPFVFEDAADDDHRELADRLASGLIADLSRAHLIRVIAWHTMRQYTGKTGDVAAIGAELGTRYVVEGNLHRYKSELLVNVALIDARNRLQVWSDRFERPFDDAMAMTHDISRALARRLQLGVLTDLGRPDGAIGRRDEAVERLLAKGWTAFMQSVSAGVPGPAETYFSRALAKDPQNVSALAGLAAHDTVVAGFRPDLQEARLTRARELLAKAIEKAPFSSLPRYYLGRVYKLSGNLAAARGEFLQAVELNPSYAPAYAEIGQLAGLSGQFDEGLSYIQYAFRLSPRDPAAAAWSVFAGQIEIERGNLPAAISWLERAATLSPRSAMAHAYLAAAHALAGHQSEAAGHVAKVQQIAPGLTG